jgi:hypothetical protein
MAHFQCLQWKLVVVYIFYWRVAHRSGKENVKGGTEGKSIFPVAKK